MRVGESKILAQGDRHKGHVITVTKVETFPQTPYEPGAPDAVTVSCSCGDAWTFEDIEE